MNAKDYLAEVRDLVNDPNGNAYDDNEILRYVSSFMERFFARARLANEEIFTTFSKGVLSQADFTVDADNEQYSTAPFDNQLITNITGLWIRSGGRRDILMQRFDNSQTEEYLYDEDRDHLTFSPLRYDVVGGVFELHGAVPNAFTIDIAYERIPPRLFIGKVTGKVAVGGHDTFKLLYNTPNPVSGFLDRRDGRYVGTRIQGTDILKDSPVREITSFVLGGTEAVFTIRGLAPEIVDDDEIATIPLFPEDFHHLLALGGAALAAGVRGASKLYRMLIEQRTEALREAIILLEQRTSQTRNVFDTS